jgi:uncharacterized protein (DUF58 family)
MIKFFRQLYLTRRFFTLFAFVIFIVAMGFIHRYIAVAGWVLLACAVALLSIDIFNLFSSVEPVSCRRKLTDNLNLGDDNRIVLIVKNKSKHLWRVSIIDELPEQFQKRDFSIPMEILPEKEERVEYSVKPLTRGDYQFGNIHLFLSTQFGLTERRTTVNADRTVKVFPSVLLMKKYELLALSRLSFAAGVKQLRKLGHSYEFEQINKYVPGDDTRSINWKASGRYGELMINHYEDERSQQIYCLIDSGRLMQTPFEGMSLFDYAINTSLVISNLVLKKHDKAGLVTFSDKIKTFEKANNGTQQLTRIFHSLYNQKESDNESDYNYLYNGIKTIITNRSLLFLFTNYESLSNLRQHLQVLRRLNKRHLLVVIFFTNTELEQYATKERKRVFDSNSRAKETRNTCY